MKLAITRKQTEQTDRRGRSEGVLYGFSCRLSLDPHETELIEKYDQAGYPIKMLMMDDVRDYRPSDKDRILTVARLSEGWSVESRFVTDLQRTEASIKEGCADFTNLLVVMASYGGDEEVEF